MSNDEISAFAAYAAKKRKTKKVDVLGLKIKSKNKLKKKRKASHEQTISKLNSVFGEVEFDGNGFSKSIIQNEKSQLNKSKLIEYLVESRKESIFSDCNLTKKVDNIFFKSNNASGENSVNSKKMKENSQKQIQVFDIGVKLQKPKKIKKQTLDDSISTHNKINSESDEIKDGNNVVVISDHVKPKNLQFRRKLELSNIIFGDSVKMGEEVFSWMLSPLKIEDFFKDCWEQKPLHVKHNNENFFKCLCSLEDFANALKENDMYFTKNIDITSYINGEKFTDNPVGKARPAVVWDMYKNGKSVRLLNPQTFIPNIRLLNTTLQEFFQCFVGANIYLTPPGTQGFAPHYDDIEAFVLQLEGEKHWKLYNPRSPDEVLPRESSKNFHEDEIGEPIMELTLKPGDLLYFPRGMIHQAKCLPHIHSLHVTVSCYQKTSWADLFEKILPVALQRAINEDVEFRKGLPIGYLSHLGMVNCDQNSEQRRQMTQKFQELAQKILEFCPLDAGVDQMGADFVYDAMPPCLTEEEKLHGGCRDERTLGKSLLDSLKYYNDKNLAVKLIRASSVRLVSEQDETVLYYTTDNSLVYHEQEPITEIVSVQYAQGIDYLICSYPNFVEIKTLPVSVKGSKPAKWTRQIEFVYFLWQKGLLLFDRPLRQICS